MKVVLAVDQSPSAETVLSGFLSRPWPAKTQVCVLNIVDLYKYFLGTEYIQPAEAIELKSAIDFTGSLADRLIEKGMESTYQVFQGYPVTGIVDFAKEWKADLILIGSQRHSAVSRFLLGSVAKGVIRHADCAVEIVRPARNRTDGAMKVLLATDGSEYSVAAAHSIAARPWPDGTEVRIISVVEYELPAIDPWYASTDVIQQINRERTQTADEAVAVCSQIVEGGKLKIRKEVASGSIKSAILDTAEDWDADLIVVGSHGRRGITRLLMGSVAESVAIGAHCSVEVVRKPRAS